MVSLLALFGLAAPAPRRRSRGSQGFRGSRRLRRPTRSMERMREPNSAPRHRNSKSNSADCQTTAWASSSAVPASPWPDISLQTLCQKPESPVRASRAMMRLIGWPKRQCWMWWRMGQKYRCVLCSWRVVLASEALLLLRAHAPSVGEKGFLEGLRERKADTM